MYLKTNFWRKAKKRTNFFYQSILWNILFLEENKKFMVLTHFLFVQMASLYILVLYFLFWCSPLPVLYTIMILIYWRNWCKWKTWTRKRMASGTNGEHVFMRKVLKICIFSCYAKRIGVSCGLGVLRGHIYLCEKTLFPLSLTYSDKWFERRTKKICSVLH